MLRLNEAVLCYLKTAQAGDGKARMDIEAQLRSTNTLVTKSTSEPELPESSLMDGSVISVKEEWSFVVGNLGDFGAAGMAVGRDDCFRQFLDESMLRRGEKSGSGLACGLGCVRRRGFCFSLLRLCGHKRLRNHRRAEHGGGSLQPLAAVLSEIDGIVGGHGGS